MSGEQHDSASLMLQVFNRKSGQLEIVASPPFEVGNPEEECCAYEWFFSQPTFQLPEQTLDCIRERVQQLLVQGQRSNPQSAGLVEHCKSILNAISAAYMSGIGDDFEQRTSVDGITEATTEAELRGFFQKLPAIRADIKYRSGLVNREQHVSEILEECDRKLVSFDSEIAKLQRQIGRKREVPGQKSADLGATQTAVEKQLQGRQQVSGWRDICLRLLEDIRQVRSIAPSDTSLAMLLQIEANYSQLRSLISQPLVQDWDRRSRELEKRRKTRRDDQVEQRSTTEQAILEGLKKYKHKGYPERITAIAQDIDRDADHVRRVIRTLVLNAHEQGLTQQDIAKKFSLPLADVQKLTRRKKN